ncbi:3',5'-cyclic-AMP phosphodiesterase [Endozoicomonas sp. 8E]|uniref:3',5'-cyclic-AMP phosphodiesterase n=1 Tax=Endozoicomonas sp. 8E TaxID=3035692 RepID=UPI0029393F80|nr:3',5'-cyclic-AMP phosphodiesterase [Endozoicomonas sp. 8E]WOG26706.1 3',5'-cyclic-AMP phosphodiesterase [Endozoicomonas sp. 8E]
MTGIRIIQLTDTHLFGSPERRLMGVDTNQSFLDVWEKIQSSSFNPDVFLVTGDLSQDESLESYQSLKTVLDTSDKPYLWTCGNHDDAQLMQRVSPEAMSPYLDSGPWQIIMLNSQIPGQVPGFLSDKELQLLEKHLYETPDKHTLVAFHHPAYTIESQWLDTISLKNAEQFMSLIQSYSNVRLVINGHIHQERDQIIQNTRFLSTPSTCVQFKPECDNFMLDDRWPGYRELELMPDGTLHTRVVRLEGYSLKPDLNANGY